MQICSWGCCITTSRCSPATTATTPLYTSVGQPGALPFAPGVGSAALLTRDVALLNQGTKLNISYVYASGRQASGLVTLAAAHN